MAIVLAREEMHVPYYVPVKFEETDHGWVASNDELQVAAAGESQEQAKVNFISALHAMVREFGADMLAKFKNVQLVEFD